MGAPVTPAEMATGLLTALAADPGEAWADDVVRSWLGDPGDDPAAGRRHRAAVRHLRHLHDPGARQALAGLLRNR